MSSDSAKERELELIAFKAGGETTRPKRRTISERRRRARGRPKQRTSPKEKLSRSSSVDSGAGGEDEDEGSASEADSDFKLKSRRGRTSRVSSSDDRTHTARPYQQSGNHTKSRAKQINSNTLSVTPSVNNDNSQTDGHPKRNSTQTVTSDSAISTSTVSTSTLVTSAESPLRSSPNLSDQSKPTSSSPPRTRSPEFSHALRRKQERIKRQLDLRETRSRLERLRFTEKAYQSNRMMVLTSSLSRRRQMSRSAGSHRTRTPTSHSFPMGKESRRAAASKGESTQPGTSSALGETKSSKGEKLHLLVKDESSSSSFNDKHVTDEVSASPALNTSASSPRLEPSKPPEHNMSQATSKEDIAASSSKHFYSSKPQTNAAESKGAATSSEDRVRSRSSHRDGRSRKKHREASQKENRSKSDNAQNKLAVIPKGGATRAENNMSMPQNLPSTPRNEDDFEKLAKRLESSPRDHSSADQVETRMTHAMDAIFRDGMPDMPSLAEITEKGLMDWRAVFRVEMMRLRREVNEFRIFCHQQVELHALAVEKSWRGQGSEDNDTKPDSSRRDAPKVTEQLKELEVNMKLFQRKQKILDQETELLEKEEQLSDKVKHLEEYEKEILEVESMLNQRQAICDRRQKALVNLDEELQALRQELEETKEHINSDGSIPESNSERARKNWDMVRRNLMDKQQLLETTVQKYRSELAAATSTIAGKDILISRLQSAAMYHEEEMANRDKRIQQLESKLTVALSETRNLTEQMSGSSQRDSMSIFGDLHASTAHRRPSQDTATDTNRVSFRSSSAYYRRPSSNAGSEQGDDYVTKTHNGTVGGESSGGCGESSRMNGSRISRKRNSVSDNAISRLTLTTPRTDDKFGRGSSACTVQ